MGSAVQRGRLDLRDGVLEVTGSGPGSRQAGSHHPLFSEFRPPDAATRLRALAAIPIACWVGAQLCLDFVRLAPGLAPTVFALVRLALFAGALTGLFRGAWLVLKVRHDFSARAVVWLVVLAVFSLLCAWTLLALTPWLF